MEVVTASAYQYQQRHPDLVYRGSKVTTDGTVVAEFSSEKKGEANA